MKFYKKLLKLIVVFIIVLVTLNVFAHDAWVEPGNGPVFHILFGHKIPEVYNPVKVASLKIFDIKKQPVIYKRIATQDGLDVKVVKGVPALFVMEFDNGYWVKTDNESHNVPRSAIPAGSDPLHAIKYSKTILHWQPWMSQPQGQRIEFVPVGISSAPKAGSELKLRLLLDGKALSGQMVENNSNEQGPTTDANGYATVTVLKGINRFATDHDMTQPGNADVKRLSVTSVFVFEAK